MTIKDPIGRINEPVDARDLAQAQLITDRNGCLQRAVALYREAKRSLETDSTFTKRIRLVELARDVADACLEAGI